jgi:hypothetical protein
MVDRLFRLPPPKEKVSSYQPFGNFCICADDPSSAENTDFPMVLQHGNVITDLRAQSFNNSNLLARTHPSRMHDAAC